MLEITLEIIAMLETMQETTLEVAIVMPMLTEIQKILEAIKTQIITHVSFKRRVMHICHSFLFLGK